MILVKPIPSAAAEQVFALTRGRIFWLVLGLFFHILLCFGWKRGSRSARVKLSGDRRCRADESKLEIEEKQNGSFDQCDTGWICWKALSSLLCLNSDRFDTLSAEGLFSFCTNKRAYIHTHTATVYTSACFEFFFYFCLFCFTSFGRDKLLNPVCFWVHLLAHFLTFAHGYMGLLPH